MSSEPTLHVAVTTGTFPLPSETFVLSHITGLLDAGLDVSVLAEYEVPRQPNEHPVIEEYGLRRRLTAVQPPADVDAELGYWPPWGQTWAPGAERSESNAARMARVAPLLLRSVRSSPVPAGRWLLSRDHPSGARRVHAAHRLLAASRLRRPVDVCHVHFGPVASDYRFLRPMFDAPLVVSFHGYDVTQWPRLRGPSVYARLFGDADLVLTNSDIARVRLERQGCPAEKLTIRRYGLDLTQFPFRPRTLAPREAVRLLSVARLVEKKGLEYAIRAVAVVAATYDDVHYDIVGDGPLRAELERLVASLGLTRSVTFHGTQNAPFVREMLDRAHVFLLPSVTAANGDEEGTPVSLIEAQATGLPVVSTRHSGIPEIIAPMSQRFLVPERDESELAARLCDLLASPQQWPDLGTSGRRFAEQHFDRVRLDAQLVDQYDELVTRRTNRAS
jgi:colanic acid/amylovoran biosynthesis glycosyltransferase